MRQTRFGRVLLVVVLVLGIVATMSLAQAATVNLTIQDFSFSPATAQGVMGTTFHWMNNGPSTHTTSGDTPLSFWDSGFLTVGQTFDKILTASGTYGYHCNIHPTIMKGTVRVPIRVMPASGTTATVFTITMATVNAVSPFVYDVQMKTGTGPFVNYVVGTTNRTT